MKCPACTSNLKEVQQSDLTVDVCDPGCGGIWFDTYELQKVDEAHESTGEALLNIKPSTPVAIDPERKRNCPRCETQPLVRHYFSVRKEIEIDDCPACGGVWLDIGELAAIRNEFKSDAARKQAGEDYFQKLFSEDFAEGSARREATSEKAHQMARAVRFVCPSYWIPGKQRWGAF